jgi:hypothetical protein
MKISSTARYALVISAAAILAACNGGGSASSALSPTALNAAQVGLHRNGSLHLRMVPSLAAKSVAVMHPDHRKSWVSPDAKRAPRLLFISDYGADDVNIYTMPAMVLKGSLTGFTTPEGMCSDTSGNIWISDTGAQQMELFSRTGTLLKTLSVPNEFPASCAVNKTNGDLAVGNIEDATGSAGNIEIFHNATGTGTPYTNGNIFEYFFVGYDPSGNLFFDGTDSSRAISYLGELLAGSSNTETISLSGGTLHLAGFIQWYNAGNYLALGDQMCGGTTASCVYWVTVSGSTATITGTTNLSNSQGGAVCDLVQGVIAANGEKYLAGPDYEGTCASGTSTAYRWAFDAGGTPTNFNNSSSLAEPIGAAVSTK